MNEVMEELCYSKVYSAAADYGDENMWDALEEHIGVADIVDGVDHLEYVEVLPDEFESVPVGDNS